MDKINREAIASEWKARESTALQKLAHMRQEADVRGIALPLLDTAEKWVKTFQGECIAFWQEPHIVSFAEGIVDNETYPDSIILVWFNCDRSLLVAISERSSHFQTREGGDDEKEEDAQTPEDRARIWAWLWEQIPEA